MTHTYIIIYVNQNKNNIYNNYTCKTKPGITGTLQSICWSFPTAKKGVTTPPTCKLLQGAIGCQIHCISASQARVDSWVEFRNMPNKNIAGET